MRYNPTDRDANEVIRSYPFKVRFAGFTGDTLSLASQGWSFSMNQSMNNREHSIYLHLILKHEGMGIYAYTNNLSLRRDYIGSASAYMEAVIRYAEIGFEVAQIGSQFRVCVQNQMGMGGLSFADSYQPIDPRPQFEEHSLSELRFFKPANPQLKDIIVLPEQVPEMMEMILGAQKKTIKEIQAREKSRSNYEKQFGNIEVKPAHETHIQIVSLTG